MKFPFLALTLALATSSFAAHAAYLGEDSQDQQEAPAARGQQQYDGQVTYRPLDVRKKPLQPEVIEGVYPRDRAQRSQRDQRDPLPPLQPLPQQDDDKGSYEDQKGDDQGGYDPGPDLCQGTFTGSYAGGAPVTITMSRAGRNNIWATIVTQGQAYQAQGQCQSNGGQAQFGLGIVNMGPQLNHEGIIQIGAGGALVMQGQQVSNVVTGAPVPFSAVGQAQGGYAPRARGQYIPQAGDLQD